MQSTSTAYDFTTTNTNTDPTINSGVVGATIGALIITGLIGFGVSVLAARIGAGWALNSHDRKR